ncbi:hypothetical protein TCAL_03070 [Tigriopus californicus]|uniref:Ion transport domain-containing protein n=1 Tax=Tigriopus californicus TaxID=6832 RepID=A0A553NUU3_TIGCA|nr:uncharacterized protein LOC131877792 [Tigriopus californicus]TRY69186.1 hypothetical protein TCAL_03070 [Tigriopus californicus]
MVMLQSVGNQMYMEGTDTNPPNNTYVNQDQHNQFLYIVPDQRGSIRTKRSEDVDSESYLIAEDPEQQFGRAIVKGDKDEVLKILAKYDPHDNFITSDISCQKIADDLDDRGLTCACDKLSPLNLAIFCGQTTILDVLLEHGLEKSFTFKEHLLCQHFKDPGLVFNRLCARSCDICSDLLDLRLDSNFDDPNLQQKRDTVLKIDLGILCRKPQSDSFASEMTTLIDMTHNEDLEILIHPVVGTFLHVKWQKVKRLFYVTQIYCLLFAVSTTLNAFAFSERNKTFDPNDSNVFFGITLALEIPLLIGLAQRVWLRRWNFAVDEWYPVFSLRLRWNKKKMTAPIHMPSFSWIALCELGLHLAVIGHFSSRSWPLFQRHCGIWSVLLAWVHLLNKVHQDPNYGFHVVILYAVVKDILKILLNILPLWLGIAFAVYLSFGNNLRDFSPLAFAPLALIKMTFEGDNSFFRLSKLDGTAQILYMLFILLLVVGLVNVLIGAANFKFYEIVKFREYLWSQQTILCVSEIEDSLKGLSWGLSKIQCLRCWNPVKMVSIFSEGEENCIVNVYPFDSSTRIGRTERSFKTRLSEASMRTRSIHLPVFRISDSSYQAKALDCSVPWNIWEKAKDVIELWHAKRRLREQEVLANAETEADQRPYYWNPNATTASEKSEPYYEIVDDSASFRIIRESHSLLKEIQRDLSRFPKTNVSASVPFHQAQHARTSTNIDMNHLNMFEQPGNNSSDGKGNSKSKTLSVRPGVALGVITLSAANHGPRITLH